MTGAFSRETNVLLNPKHFGELLHRRRGTGRHDVLGAVSLARAGVGVMVLEKHADFLRDFRGETIYPDAGGHA